MGGALKYTLPGAGAKRVLVIAEDYWLRFRLRHAFERAGCEADSLAEVGAESPAPPQTYDMVVADSSSLPREKRLEALALLRQRFSQARLILLTGLEERLLEAQALTSGIDLVVERPHGAETLPDLVWEALAERQPSAGAVPVPMKFEFFLMASAGPGKRGTGSALTSLVVHSLVLTMVLLVPLVYTESLDVQALTSTWLMAPPPPPPAPPPPPSPEAMKMVKRVRPALPTEKLIAPTSIPKEILRIVDRTDTELDTVGVVGGVVGGVPGGQMGGIIGGVIGGIAVPKPPPPPIPLSEAIRVGGKIRPPRQIRRVEPLYPDIAKQARIQGNVRIDAIIDTSGRVVEMKVLSGHPLLANAALSAVQQWLFEPTLLNETPVPVVLEVTVTFRLYQ